jgi:hypothetical protein
MDLCVLGFSVRGWHDLDAGDFEHGVGRMVNINMCAITATKTIHVKFDKYRRRFALVYDVGRHKWVDLVQHSLKVKDNTPPFVEFGVDAAVKIIIKGDDSGGNE